MRFLLTTILGPEAVPPLPANETVAMGEEGSLDVISKVPEKSPAADGRNSIDATTLAEGGTVSAPNDRRENPFPATVWEEMMSTELPVFVIAISRETDLLGSWVPKFRTLALRLRCGWPFCVPRPVTAAFSLAVPIAALIPQIAQLNPKGLFALKRMLEDPARRLVLVAEADGAVIGMVTAQLVISTAEGGDAGILEDLVVDEAHRRTGVGRRLLAAAEAWARARGATRLQLLADVENGPALDFYARTGWSRTQLVCLRRGGG